MGLVRSHMLLSLYLPPEMAVVPAGRNMCLRENEEEKRKKKGRWDMRREAMERSL